VCGITGILFKNEPGPIGAVQVRMLAPLHRRGPDSAGVALYGRPVPGYVVRARTRSNGNEPLCLEVGDTPDVAGLANDIERSDRAVDVLSVGHAMQILKEVGSAADLDRAYGVSDMTGTHAIGHTRMATESRVDTLHSHPFWARPFADIALVHNGHITNEHKLRRRLARHGHEFFTHNDSEVLAVYIADKLEQGAELSDALRDSVTELDGTFAYLISTPRGIGLARDPFGTKPLLWAETHEFVILASEEVAIRAAFPELDLRPRELGAGEVRSWSR
jgi:methylamine---glutamate N-methyltransferase subunit A